MPVTAWPFGTDADRDDPLTALRIPAVGSFNPRWKYVAAYLKPATGDLAGPPFGSNERPTGEEARMLASFIQEYIQHWFNEGYQARLAERALDVDSGCNTTVFIKYGPDDWGHRRCSWSMGPTFVPGPAGSPSREVAGQLTLAKLMDRIHTIADDKPMKRWQEWKAAHPEVFRGDQ
ncbi:hypothetical protein [Streptomyces nigrescens]|uniref:hypothetical protein n=1 Tax=Streptomyces nigrescens TaxID=1920 RepID=UPI0036AFC26C